MPNKCDQKATKEGDSRLGPIVASIALDKAGRFHPVCMAHGGPESSS